MELPKELIDKVRRAEKLEDERRRKKISKVQYQKRKLDKAVKKYVNGCIENRSAIRSRDIDRIARRHKFHTS